MREEALDHCMIFGRRVLRKVVFEFIDYYHNYRPHQGLNQGAPLKKHDQPIRKQIPKIKRKIMVDRIITNFELAA